MNFEVLYYGVIFGLMSVVVGAFVVSISHPEWLL